MFVNLSYVLVVKLRLLHWQSLLKNSQLEKQPSSILFKRNTFTRNMLANVQTLSPFVSPEGLIHVGSNLNNAIISNDATQKSYITLLDHFHTLELHDGPHTTQDLLFQEHWILSLWAALHSHLQNCVKCRCFSAKPVQPVMSPLPTIRVNPFMDLSFGRDINFNSNTPVSYTHL